MSTVAVLVGVALVPMRSANAVPAVGTDIIQGKVGKHVFPDAAAHRNGVVCVYTTDGTLRAVRVPIPKAQARAEWKPGQGVRWTAELQSDAAGPWTKVDALTSFTGVKHALVTVNPLRRALGSGRSLPIADYRVVEKLTFIANKPNRAGKYLPQGSASHVEQTYFYGDESTVHSACSDRRPNVVGLGDRTVEEGDPVAIPAPGLLAGASDPDGEPVTAEVKSVVYAGTATAVPYASTPNGQLTVPTSHGDANKSIVVTYVAVDFGGLESLPQTMTIHVLPAPVSSLPAPQNLKYSAPDGSHITLTWSAVPDAHAYRVYLPDGTHTDRTDTNYTASGRTACTSYGYQVAATDTAGNAGKTSSIEAKSGNAAPTAADGAQGIKAGSHITRKIYDLAGDADGNIVTYKLISTGFGRTGFQFTWNATNGTFQITPPAGSGGASYLTWEAIDSCGSVSRTATEKLDFVA